MGKMLVGGWHSELGGSNPPAPGNSHPGCMSGKYLRFVGLVRVVTAVFVDALLSTTRTGVRLAGRRTVHSLYGGGEERSSGGQEVTRAAKVII